MAAYKIDNKRRITLKEAKPGEVYDVQHLGGGHYKLARMKTEPEPKGEALEDTSANDDPETVASEAAS